MVHDEPVHPDSFVKIFNCYKNATTDRQIGDIRGQNSIESRLVGPSRELPAGPQEVTCRTSQIPEVMLERNGPQRFLSPTFLDTLPSHFQYSGPGVPWSMLEGTKGYANFLLSYVRPEKGFLWTSFCSVLQGDHGGVEICTDAHVNLLQSYGLLDGGSRLVSSRPLLSSSVADGLVIDDYFCISREEVATPNDESIAFARYMRLPKRPSKRCVGRK